MGTSAAGRRPTLPWPGEGMHLDVREGNCWRRVRIGSQSRGLVISLQRGMSVMGGELVLLPDALCHVSQHICCVASRTQRLGIQD